MTPAQGVEDVEPGVVNPGGSPLPLADTSASGHPNKKEWCMPINTSTPVSLHPLHCCRLVHFTLAPYALYYFDLIWKERGAMSFLL